MRGIWSPEYESHMRALSTSQQMEDSSRQASSSLLSDAPITVDHVFHSARTGNVSKTQIKMSTPSEITGFIPEKKRDAAKSGFARQHGRGGCRKLQNETGSGGAAGERPLGCAMREHWQRQAVRGDRSVAAPRPSERRAAVAIVDSWRRLAGAPGNKILDKKDRAKLAGHC